MATAEIIEQQSAYQIDAAGSKGQSLFFCGEPPGADPQAVVVLEGFSREAGPYPDLAANHMPRFALGHSSPFHFAERAAMGSNWIFASSLCASTRRRYPSKRYSRECHSIKSSVPWAVWRSAAVSKSIREKQNAMPVVESKSRSRNASFRALNREENNHKQDRGKTSTKCRHARSFGDTPESSGIDSYRQGGRRDCTCEDARLVFESSQPVQFLSTRCIGRLVVPSPQN